MKIPFLPKNKWLRLSVAMLAFIIVPYAFSRIASPWRVLTIHTNPDSGRAQPKSSSTPLRIACYNIAHGRGVALSNWDGGDLVERVVRLDRIAELLRRIDADVVILNEVDFDSTWSDSANQARILAERSGYPHWIEQRNLDARILTWKWRFGNAILSKYPITSAHLIDLPGFSKWETLVAGKKRAVICEITVGDTAVRIIGVHLSHRSETLRARSAGMITNIAAESKLPVIVAGDLNSTPPDFPDSSSDADGNNTIAVFDQSQQFRRVPASLPLADKDMTFPSTDPVRVIDWILIPRAWHFSKYRVEPSLLSDHRPVCAEIKESGKLIK